MSLARLVTAQVRATGRHHLGEPLLAALEDVQHRHCAHDAFLDAFLDSILARRQDRFRNQTYLALPLLDRILADPSSGLNPERLSAMLVANVIRHEASPHQPGTDRTDHPTQAHPARRTHRQHQQWPGRRVTARPHRHSDRVPDGPNGRVVPLSPVAAGRGPARPFTRRDRGRSDRARDA